MMMNSKTKTPKVIHLILGAYMKFVVKVICIVSGIIITRLTSKSYNTPMPKLLIINAAVMPALDGTAINNSNLVNMEIPIAITSNNTTGAYFLSTVVTEFLFIVECGQAAKKISVNFD